MNTSKTAASRLLAPLFAITSAIAASSATLPSAFASSEIEEVKVVADFRGGDAANLPTSITVLNEAVIKQSGARHFDELIGALPNVNFSGGTSRARFFQIRGIGERSQFASPLNPSVGYIVDNVDFSGVGSIGTLLDVSQVEVFRGPQGTRYGANALAGLIYIKTNDPTEDQSISLNLSAGEYDHRTIGLVYNQPLGDGVAARLAVEKHDGDGFYQNDFLNEDDNNARDETTARLKMAVEDFGGWALDIALSTVDIDNGYDTFSLDNNRRTRSDQPGKDSQQSDAISVELNRAFDQVEVQLIAAVADSDLEYSYDEDWTFTGFDPIGYTSFDEYKRDKSVRSLEARIISDTSHQIFNDTTDWLVGVYRIEQVEDLTRNYTFLGGPFTSDYDYESTALFAQLETELSDQWTLDWGARTERRTTDYENSDLVNFSPSESLWGGRIALKYNLVTGGMAYISLARGYKAGGFNTDGTIPAALREFDSESLIEWEAGIKTTRFDNTLLLSAAIFHDERRDQQVKSSFVRTRADGSTEFVDFLGNAAEGTNNGLELNLTWLATEQLSVDAAFAVLDAEFDDFINEFGEDLSGRDQAQAPGHSYHLSLLWREGPWTATLSFQGKDEYFFSDRHRLKSTNQNTVNANVAYASNRFSVNLWGRNLSDRDYTVRGFGSFGNDPRNGYATEPYVAFGDPRVIGVTTEFHLGNR